MPTSPDALDKVLAGPLPSLAVVAGEEPLLIMEAADALRATARAQGFDERVVLDAEKGFAWHQVRDEGNSLSLFVQRRLIEVRVTGALGADGAAALTEWLARPPPDVFLLVILGALDARARKAAWAQSVDRQGVLVYVWPLKPDQFPAWVSARARRVGVSLTSEALAALVDRTEGNVLACAQDLQKLKLLVEAGQTVDLDLLRAAVSDNARFGVFDLTDRVLGGDATGSVRSLQRLREEGVAVQEVLAGLLWSLRQWAQAAQTYGRTRDAAGACERAGVRRFQIEAYSRALTRSGPTWPLAWLRYALWIDAESKSTGGEPSAWRDLLTLVLAASGAAPLPNQRRA